MWRDFQISLLYAVTSGWLKGNISCLSKRPPPLKSRSIYMQNDFAENLCQCAHQRLEFQMGPWKRYKFNLAYFFAAAGKRCERAQAQQICHCCRRRVHTHTQPARAHSPFCGAMHHRCQVSALRETFSHGWPQYVHLPPSPPPRLPLS